MNDGLLALRFRTDKYGRTRLVERRQRYPMTTTGVLPFESESGALIYTQNAAGTGFIPICILRTMPQFASQRPPQLVFKAMDWLLRQRTSSWAEGRLSNRFRT